MCCFLVMGTASCARSVDPATGYRSTAISDPLEFANRTVFAFNNILDLLIIEPVAHVYTFIVPEFMRDGVQNFMRNLNSPIIVGNQILQADGKGAGVAVARFVINSTIGIGGLIDVASRYGLEYESEDFGQTLGVWGLGHGFYLVLPVLGPSSLRDGVGLAVDGFADPVRIVTHNTDNEWIYYSRIGLEGLDTRSRLLKAIKDLRQNSLDYYAAVRSAYGQKREALVKDQQEATPAAIPDYDDEMD